MSDMPYTDAAFRGPGESAGVGIVRECSVCPPYISRCAHFGERTVMMTDKALWESAPPDHDHVLRAPYQVVLGRVVPTPSWCPCGGVVDYQSVYVSTAHEASEHFARFEAILLGREED